MKSCRAAHRACLVGGLLLLALTTRIAAQEPGDWQELRERLAREQEENRRQSERIRELELSLFSVVEAQDTERREAELSAEIEALVGRTVDERLAATVRREPRSPLSIRGQGRFVIRAFGGDEISTDESVELEHMILQLRLRLDDDLTLNATPAVSHQGQLALITAYLDWRLDDAFALRAGRFLVPVNGVHAWAFPSDSFIEPYLPENAPKPFLYSPWWDEGAMAHGRLRFGADDEHQLRYSLWVINGFDAAGLQGFHKRNIGDNNRNKTIGGRLAADFRLGQESRIVVGLGAMHGKYDDADRLEFVAVEVDAEWSWGPFSLYAELFYRESEIAGTVIENPAAVVQDVARLRGIKIRPRLRIAESLSIYAQFDHLEVRQAPRSGGQFSVLALDDESFAVTTWLAGIEFEATANLLIFLEAGFFDRELGDDIPFLSTGFYTSF